MNVKKRLFKLHRVELAVKIFIILFLKICWLLGPRRIWVVDDIVNRLSFCFSIFRSIFRKWKCLFFSAKFNRHRHKLVVFCQQFANAIFF